MAFRPAAFRVCTRMWGCRCDKHCLFKPYPRMQKLAGWLDCLPAKLEGSEVSMGIGPPATNLHVNNAGIWSPLSTLPSDEPPSCSTSRPRDLPSTSCSSHTPSRVVLQRAAPRRMIGWAIKRGIQGATGASGTPPQEAEDAGRTAQNHNKHTDLTPSLWLTAHADPQTLPSSRRPTLRHPSSPPVPSGMPFLAPPCPPCDERPRPQRTPAGPGRP